MRVGNWQQPTLLLSTNQGAGTATCALNFSRDFCPDVCPQDGQPCAGARPQLVRYPVICGAHVEEVSCAIPARHCQCRLDLAQQVVVQPACRHLRAPALCWGKFAPHQPINKQPGTWPPTSSAVAPGSIRLGFTGGLPAFSPSRTKYKVKPHTISVRQAWVLCKLLHPSCGKCRSINSGTAKRRRPGTTVETKAGAIQPGNTLAVPCGAASPRCGQRLTI